MHLNNDYIAGIIVKKIQGKCTDAECLELKRWAESDPRNEALLHKLLDSERMRAQLLVLNDVDNDAAWQKLLDQGLVRPDPVRVTMWKRIVIAAAILVVGTFVFFALNEKQPPVASGQQRVVETTHPKYKNDVLPAIEGATLITAKGNAISLSNAIAVHEDGTVVDEHNAEVVSLEQLEIPVYHELVVPQTNYFSFQLSDGTKVWVNANSRLSFPSRFARDERKVRLLEGEAYFDVAHRDDQPFIVETAQANVRVLGTQFNVRNYKSNFATTLAEGSVEVYNATETRRIKPHEQAFLRAETLGVRNANLTKELAWKNNVFYFRNDNLRNVMMQIENWYGVSVTLDRSLATNTTYSGEIKRDVPLSQMLDMLEFTSGLEFSLEGTHLHIKPKKA